MFGPCSKSVLIDFLIKLRFFADNSFPVVRKWRHPENYTAGQWAGRRHWDRSAHEQLTGNTVRLSVDLPHCLAVYFPAVRASMFNPLERTQAHSEKKQVRQRVFAHVENLREGSDVMWLVLACLSISRMFRKMLGFSRINRSCADFLDQCFSISELHILTGVNSSKRLLCNFTHPQQLN